MGLPYVTYEELLWFTVNVIGTYNNNTNIVCNSVLKDSRGHNGLGQCGLEISTEFFIQCGYKKDRQVIRSDLNAFTFTLLQNLNSFPDLQHQRLAYC